MMNSKWSYLVSTLTYHLRLLQMKSFIDYFKTFSSCKGGFANKKSPKKCKSSESSANHSISHLSLHSSESNGVSKNPFSKPGVLVSLLSLLSKQTLPARDCVPNQSCRQCGSLRSDSEALMAFRFTIFSHLPF